MATELVFDAKKGGAIIVIFPTGEFYINANPDTEGGLIGLGIQELMKDDDWKSRLVERVKALREKKQRDDMYEELRKRPTKL